MPKAYPADDPRYEAVAAEMRRRGLRPEALVPVLHVARRQFGTLPRSLLSWIARSLDLPPAKVRAVSAFDHLLRTDSVGRHTCVVCTGSACQFQGADKIVEALTAAADLALNRTSPDGSLTLCEVRCFGACHWAPAAIGDGRVWRRLTPRSAVKKLKDLLTE